MSSARIRRNWRRILPFAVIFVLTGWVFLFVEWVAADGPAPVGGIAITLDASIFLMITGAVALMGLFVGWIETVAAPRLYDRRRFATKVGYKLLMYGLIFHLGILIAYPLAAAVEQEMSPTSVEVWHRFVAYLTSPIHLSTLIQMTASLLLCLIYAEGADTVGHRALLNFFTGRYHQPTEEERTFMFADMRGSTTIAEQLGHVEYFKLLRQYYADISDAIVEHGGEIYQYVGDEVIISWRHREGCGADARWMHCFRDMQAALAKKTEWYTNRFGVVPGFKTGVHCGRVTTGEIGVVRREIFFTGDVLNTAARIQGLCNSYGTDLLASEALVSSLQGSEYMVRMAGSAELRGKRQQLTLYRVANAVSAPPSAAAPSVVHP